MADILPLRVHSFGNIELLTRTPLAIKAGLGADLAQLRVICVIFFGVVTYFLANFLIKNSILLHLGVTGIMTMTVKKPLYLTGLELGTADQQVVQIIHLLGGKKISKMSMPV